MANSYGRLANLDDEDEPAPRGSSFSRLANLDEDEPASAPAENAETDPAETPWYQQAARQVGLAGRAVVQGVASLPMMAMDAGVAARNTIENAAHGVYPSWQNLNPFSAEGWQPGTHGTELPSVTFNKALTDVGLPEPKTASEKVAGFVESVLTGSRLPAPQSGTAAPAGFVKPSTNPLSETLRESQAAGYVVPPATAGPGLTSKIAEGIAGKTATAQAASVRNQQVTNELAKKALGLAKDEPITPASLRDLRATAGKVYEQIADSGDIHPDGQFMDDLAQLGKGADEIAQAFPGANVGATKQIGEVVDSLLQDKFSSKAALQYLRELRKQAAGNLSGINAADPAKQALGMAQREAAGTLEDLIGRHLSAQGQPELAQSFSQARKLIAMSHTVEGALNETTGNVVAGKLGQQLAKGKPLSGELETAAKFARAFPKAAKEVTESMPGMSPLDVYASLGTGLATGSVLPAFIPAVRIGIKNALLSGAGQKLMTGTPEAAQAPSGMLGLVPSAAIQAGAASQP